MEAVMARIDTARLALQVVHYIETADAVRRDPPVVKAADQFRRDVAQASRSGRVLAIEVKESWRRHR